MLIRKAYRERIILEIGALLNFDCGLAILQYE
jgi:hypothetical protein